MGSCTVFCNGGGGPGAGEVEVGSCTFVCNSGGGPEVREVEVGSCTVFCNVFLGGILSNDSFSV